MKRLRYKKQSDGTLYSDTLISDGDALTVHVTLTELSAKVLNSKDEVVANLTGASLPKLQNAIKKELVSRGVKFGGEVRVNKISIKK